METKYVRGDVDAGETREELENSLRTFYIVAKCNAFYSTLFLIATFVAETILNTIRLNEKLKSLFGTLVNGWQPLQYFQGFYPEGTKPIEIVTTPYVYIYIFAIALYAGLRLIHHRTFAHESDWPGIGPVRKANMREVSLFTRWCWLITPRRRVHRFVMQLWMWWGIIPLVVTFPLSWLGIRVFTSENLIVALVGSVILFGVNLIEDTNFFKRVPAKDVLGKMALSLVTLGLRRDFTAFAREMTHLVDGIKSGEVELVRADLATLDSLVVWADELAKNPGKVPTPPAKLATEAVPHSEPSTPV